VGRSFREEGSAGLADRSSVPERQPARTPEDRRQAIAALRRVRLTGWQIAMALQMPLSTVSGILTSIGLGKLSRLEPPEPPNRYERRMPGELIHHRRQEARQDRRRCWSSHHGQPWTRAARSRRGLGVRARLRR
jgi:hypothetical protein